jgi:hypothetical protein
VAHEWRTARGGKGRLVGGAGRCRVRESEDLPPLAPVGARWSVASRVGPGRGPMPGRRSAQVPRVMAGEGETCRSTVRWICLDSMLGSETWSVIPIVRARWAHAMG